MSGNCRTPKNEPNAQYNKLFHGMVRDALIPKEVQEYIERLKKRIIKELSFIEGILDCGSPAEARRRIVILLEALKGK